MRSFRHIQAPPTFDVSGEPPETTGQWPVLPALARFALRIGGRAEKSLARKAFLLSDSCARIIHGRHVDESAFFVPLLHRRREGGIPKSLKPPPRVPRTPHLMLDTPYVTQTTTQNIAVIHLVIAKDEIQHVMGPGIGELMAAIASQGIQPAGPIFTHHFKLTPDGWDFEIGVPVSKAVAPAGRVKPSEWPAMRVARTVYQGPYEGLGGAWGEFMDWIAANGHKPAEDLYECYLAGPESSPDPANWRTEFNKPLMP
jgi:effector-binding domain-containing protein